MATIFPMSRRTTRGPVRDHREPIMNQRFALPWQCALGFAFVVLSAASSCGGGGGSTVSEPVTTFAPNPVAPGSGTVAMLAGQSSGAMISIRIVVTDVNSFFGAAFRVTYDATALQC